MRNKIALSLAALGSVLAMASTTVPSLLASASILCVAWLIQGEPK